MSSRSNPGPAAAAAGAAAIAWLNLYFCREALFTTFSGYSNSMHGFWMALSAIPFTDWLRPTWWHLWDGGMPLEYTYAPLLPWLTGATARIAGIPVSHSWHVMAAIVYVLGPVFLFWACWRLSGSLGYSFVAAVFYSLAAPTELIVPDGTFAWAHAGDARRLYLLFTWDELPHLAALALFPLALASWERVLSRAGRWDYIAAVAATAATVLANAFGATVLAISLLCLLAARPPAEWPAVLRRIGAVSTVSYLLISPWLPPSLIAAIHRNSGSYQVGAWSWNSWKALALTAAAWLPLAWLLQRTVADRFVRFWLLLAAAFGAIAVLHQYLDWHFIPQPGRYKVELALALAVALVFAIRPAARRLPLPVQLALAAALMPVGVKQVISHRRFAKNIVRSVPAETTMEAGLARRLEQAAAGPRVFAPGSAAMWLNTFSPLPQLSGGSFPTALNPMQQMAVDTIYGRQARAGLPAEPEILWLKAFGVGAVAVTGPESREFWKPFRDPAIFDGRLPVLSADRDASIYRVPLRSSSLAHVVPRTALLRHPPAAGGDIEGLRRYVEALEDASLPPAQLTWSGPNRGVIRTRMAAGQVLSVQINFAPGWQAAREGRALPVRPDGLGLMMIETGCRGPCVVELRFTGGWEALATRLAALAVVMAGVFLVVRMKDTRPAGGG